MGVGVHGGDIFDMHSHFASVFLLGGQQHWGASPPHPSPPSRFPGIDATGVHSFYLLVFVHSCVGRHGAVSESVWGKIRQAREGDWCWPWLVDWAADAKGSYRATNTRLPKWSKSMPIIVHKISNITADAVIVCIYTVGLILAKHSVAYMSNSVSLLHLKADITAAKCWGLLVC